MVSLPSPTAGQQVRRVLIVTLILNLAVAFGKILIGLWTGALAITADGFHSLVDGSSNVVALIANAVANRPPDEDHPYGHRRFETIAALGIGAFLLLTAWEIVGSALGRFSGPEEAPTITPLTFIVMIVTLLVNIFVNRYETREGRRLHSELLLADAAHTGADILVTISVLGSMALVLAGFTWADSLAALLIVVFIVRAAWQVLRQTGGILVDTAPYSSQQLTGWVEEVPSVHQVLRARSRGPAESAHVDIDVQVQPEMTTNQTAAIAEAIRGRLSEHIEGLAEVEVHFVPLKAAPKDHALIARAHADALGLATHEVTLREGENGPVLEMHVEVPRHLTLEAAHQQVSQLEQDVRASLPDVAEVVSHIEPSLAVQLHEAANGSALRMDALRDQALALLRENFLGVDWHHLELYPVDGHWTMTMHATLPAQMSVEDAHRVAESAETLLRARLPLLDRVTIHTEPPE